MGPIKAIQRQPTTSLYLLFGGAILGLFVAKAVPAVRNIFGMAGLGTPYWCPRRQAWINPGLGDYRPVPTSDTFPWYLYGSRGTISGLGNYVQAKTQGFEA